MSATYKTGDKLKEHLDGLYSLLRQADENMRALAQFANVPITPLRIPSTNDAELANFAKELNEAWEINATLKKYLPVGTKDLAIPISLSSLYANRLTDVAIPTGADTYVEFETVYGSSGAFKIDLNNPTVVTLAYTGQAFLLVGKAYWAANATGYRNTKIEGYDADGNSLGLDTLYSAPAWSSGGSENINPFAQLVAVGQIPNMSYFKMTVGQTSGSDLNLTAFQLGLFTV